MNADYYIFNADVYCPDCAGEIETEVLQNTKPEYHDLINPDAMPVPVFSGENDCPLHCGNCQVFIGNTLTDYGRDYIIESFKDFLEFRNGNREVLLTWFDFYAGDYDINREFSPSDFEKLETVLNATETETETANN